MPTIRGQKDLVQYQIDELNNRLDAMNGELARTLKQQAELEANQAASARSAGGPRLEQRRDELRAKIERLMERIGNVTKEMQNKYSLLD